MRILLVGTYLDKGGAAHSMRKLGEALEEQGNSVRYFTISNVPFGMVVITIIKVLDRILFFRNNPKMTFPLKNKYVELFLRRISNEYDVVIYNWIGDGFLHTSQMRSNGKQLTYINVLDEVYFNFGCHYSLGCTNCAKNILKCPSIKMNAFENIYLNNSRRHFRSLASNSIRFITHNENYFNTMKVLWAKCKVIKISMPFDTNLIADDYSSRGYERAQVGFVSPQIANPRKGFEDYLKIIDLTQNSETEIGWLSAGNGDVEDHRIDHLGYLTGDNLKFFYSRIDILIFTSKQENLSNVLLNAVASGIYVLCYDVGGNKDIVNQDDLGKVFQRNELNELASYLGTINLNDLRRGRKSRALRFREKWKLQVETEVKAEF